MRKNVTFVKNSDNTSVYLQKCNTTKIGTIQIPKQIKVANQYYTVTAIGDNAFSGCNALININIPDTIQKIGATAFDNCSCLRSLYIPKSVTNMGNFVVRNCLSLENIEVDPENITYSSEEGVLFNKNKSVLKAYPCAKNNVTYNIPSSVAAMDDYAFYNCDKLVKVTIPRGVTSLGNNLFAYCDKLETVKMPDTVTEVKASAFLACVKLNDLKLSPNITSIGGSAFQECSSLLAIEIPKGVTDIKNYTFYKCSNLAKVKMYANVANIGNYAFEYCSNLRDIRISPNVTSIGTEAFAYCSNLESIAIPNETTNFGNSVFYGCGNLSRFTLPINLRTFGSNIVWADSKLKGIWTSREIYNKSTYLNCKSYGNSAALIESNLYDRDYSVNDPVIIRANNVRCYQINSDNSITEVPLVKNAGGFYVHDVYSGNHETKYFYYTAENGAYTSQVIRIGDFDYGDGDTQSDWDSENKYRLDNIIYQRLDDASVTVASGSEAYGDIEIPRTITCGGQEYSVKKINPCAFAQNDSISRIAIPDSIETIGESAFANCSDLRVVVLPDGIESLENCTFSGCSNLTSINIPDSVRNIKDFVFQGCTSLTDITLPESIESIGNGAFWYNINLRNMIIEAENFEVGSGSFFACNECIFKVKNDEVKNVLIAGGISEDKINIE